MANYAITSINFGNDNQVVTLPYGSCSTAAGTAAKTVSAGDFSLETGAVVVVKFTNTNTASNPTLNVSSTGAKAIYHKGAAINPNYLRAGFVYTFTYNGTQWDLHSALDVSAKIQTWDNASAPTSSVDIDELIINKVANANVLADMQAGGKINENEIYFVEGDTVEYVTQSEMEAAIAGIVDTAPETLNTLNELAAALGDDPNFATTIATQIGNKVDKVSGKGLSTNDYTTTEKNKLAGIAAGATANTGTITAVKANGTSVATSGEANIPAASTSAYGVTKLSSATNSTSTTLAATASAVKAAYDLAASKTDNVGTVTSVSAGTGLTGGPITSSGSLSLASGVCTAGTYGPTADVSGFNETTIKVPQITVDTYGRVTGVTERTYTSVNTDTGDTKVTQAYDASSNVNFPLLFSATPGITSTGPRGATTAKLNNKFYVNPSTGGLYGTSVYGAVWNDYAEYREGTEDFEPGRVICENGDDTLSLATERLQPGANVVSDTFGFAIGETEKAKTPIAVSGRVLVYPYEDRNSYKPGDAVCAAPGGTVSKMTREEIREYPERILGTVSAIPTYERWGEGDVPVNGRIWIKVR